MRLVKGIVGKINHLIINSICHFFRNSFRKTAVNTLFLIAINEILSLLLHDTELLLTHGTAQEVRASHRKSCKIPYNLHNLLLVDDYPVGILQNRLHFRTIILHPVLILLPGNIIRNKIHGARPIQGNSGNNIVQGRGLQAFHKVHHAGRFQLKHPCTIPAGKHPVDFFITVIQFLEIDLHPSVLLHKADGILDDRQSPKTQKIHL